MNFTNFNKYFENKYTVHKSLLREEKLQNSKKATSKKNLIESIDKPLNERDWKLTIPGNFRNAIFEAGEEEDFEGVRIALINICSYVLGHIDEANFDLADQEYVEEEFEEFAEELDYIELEDEDEVNYYLNELYDLLDNTDIFLGLRESLNEASDIDVKDINVEEIIPTKKDIDRAKGLAWRGNTFYGNGAPFGSEASKMAKLIKDPIKLVRRAKAVVSYWDPRGYVGYYSDYYGRHVDPDKDNDVWEPFRSRLIDMGFSGEQINTIKNYRAPKNESLNEEKISAGDMEQRDIDIIQPLIDDFDSLEEANKDVLSITWNFGRRNSDNKMTAGVDIYFLVKGNEDNLQPYVKQIEDIILSDGYKFDDSLGYDEDHWKEHMFGDGYHTQIIEDVIEESFNESLDYDYALEKGDYKKIDKLNELTNANTFWDDVRKLCRNVKSSHAINRWQSLAEVRYRDLTEKYVSESLTESDEKRKYIVYFKVGPFQYDSTDSDVVLAKSEEDAIRLAKKHVEKDGIWNRDGKGRYRFSPNKNANSYRAELFNESLNEEFAFKTYDELHDLDKEIKDYLNQNDFDGRVELAYITPDDVPVPSITYEIYMGDWKHEHLFFKHLIREFMDKKNIPYMMTEEDEDNGSDTYTAYHTIHLMKHTENESLKESVEPVKPTEEEFQAYCVIQHSGITNMFDINTVREAAEYELGIPLTKENIFYIFEHYQELMDEYGFDEDVWDNEIYAVRDAYGMSTDDYDESLNEGSEPYYEPPTIGNVSDISELNVGDRISHSYYGEGTIENIKDGKVYASFDGFNGKRIFEKGGLRYLSKTDESLTEDTVKQDGKWVNKGKEGINGKFKTKKEADAQRKAMFANGFNESYRSKKNLKESYHWSREWVPYKDEFYKDFKVDDDVFGTVSKYINEDDIWEYEVTINNPALGKLTEIFDSFEQAESFIESKLREYYIQEFKDFLNYEGYDISEPTVSDMIEEAADLYMNMGYTFKDYPIKDWYGTLLDQEPEFERFIVQ